MVYDDEEESFEGNQGIKDQQLALEWVRDNIGFFGGDKDLVFFWLIFYSNWSKNNSTEISIKVYI